MKRGFTLIELLAVIIVLAIISVIAVPRIMESIEDSRYGAAVNSTLILQRTMTDFITKNPSQLPNAIGETTEIPLSMLIENGNITETSSPFHGGNCDGYMLVTRIEEDFEMIPHINCIDEITNSVDDQLYLHYTFDDFQEPTINLLNPNFNSWGTSGAVIEVLSEDGLTAKIRNNGSTWPRAFNQPVSVNTGEILTFSAEIIDFHGDNNRLNIWRSGSGGSNPYGSSTLIDKIGLHSLTRVVPDEDGIDTASGWLRLDRDAPDEDHITARNSQLEKKAYPTPFVDGEREGIVKDYSLNSNNATLSLEGTPRWVDESATGKGSYLFNGEDNYIHISNNRINAKTVSLWFRTTNSSEQVLISGVFSSGSWGNLNMGSGRVSVRNNSNIVGTQERFDDGNWHHLVVINDESLSHPNRFSFYINGELVESANGLGSNRVSERFMIGRRLYQSNFEYYFDGNLDDIRIYKRMLSDEEIRILYETTRPR